METPAKQSSLSKGPEPRAKTEPCCRWPWPASATASPRSPRVSSYAPSRPDPIGKQPALYNLGRLLLTSGDPERGQILLDAASRQAVLEDEVERRRQGVEVDPRNPVAHLFLAKAYLDAERPQQALEPFRIARELDRSSAAAANGLCSTWSQLQNWPRAAKSCLEATLLAPESRPAHFLFGLAQIRLNQVEAAETALAAARPRLWNAATHLRTGEAWVETGHVDRARVTLQGARRAIAEGEESLPALRSLATRADLLMAHIAWRNENWKVARGAVDDAAEAAQDPSVVASLRADVAMTSGLLAARLGELERARTAFETAVRHQTLELLTPRGRDEIERRYSWLPGSDKGLEIYHDVRATSWPLYADSGPTNQEKGG